MLRVKAECGCSAAWLAAWWVERHYCRGECRCEAGGAARQVTLRGRRGCGRGVVGGGARFDGACARLVCVPLGWCGLGRMLGSVGMRALVCRARIVRARSDGVRSGVGWWALGRMACVLGWCVCRAGGVDSVGSCARSECARARMVCRSRMVRARSAGVCALVVCARMVSARELGWLAARAVRAVTRAQRGGAPPACAAK